MANAIHKTEAGETLESVAQAYYALRRPDASLDDMRAEAVITEIRSATAFDLSSYTDSATLPTGTEIRVPTLRRFNRVVFTGTDSNGTVQASLDALASDLTDAGFTHARKLLRYSQDEVVALIEELHPSTYAGGEVEKAYAVTQLLNLDGMDRYTANYLYSTRGIGQSSADSAYVDLADQTIVDLDSWLDDLVSTYSRPAELDNQDFSNQWKTEASLYCKPGVSKRLRAWNFPLPFMPEQSVKTAEAYEAIAASDQTDADDAEAAECLAAVFRFQEATLRGHRASLVGDHTAAVTAYHQARRYWHQLAVHFNVVTEVDEVGGLTLDQSAELSCCLCKAFPGEDDTPLGVHMPRLKRQRHVTRFKLRGFTYAELSTTEKGTLRTQMTNADTKVHELPRLLRSGLQRTTQGKTRNELNSASPIFVAGLLGGGNNVRARDFDEKEKEVLRRNIGGVDVDNYFGGGLDLFDALGGLVALSEYEGVYGSTWSSSTASSVLSTEANDVYDDANSGLMSNSNVTPFTKFVVLPGPLEGDDDVFIPILDASFVADLKEALKARLMATEPETLTWDEACWANPGAFAVLGTWLYCVQLPRGMRQAYGKLGKGDMANRYGALRINLYESDGTLVRDVGSMSTIPGMQDKHLLQCSTRWSSSGVSFYEGEEGPTLGWLEITEYCEYTMAEADRAYRRDQRDEATALYQDVLCAIASWNDELTNEARAALAGIYQTLEDRHGSKLSALSGLRLNDVSLFNVSYEVSSTPVNVLDGKIWVTVAEPEVIPSVLRAKEIVTAAFDFYAAPTWNNAAVRTDNLDVLVDPSEVGINVREGDLNIAYSEDSESDVHLFAMAAVAQARITAISCGQNWLGFRDDYVPPWSFQYLYQEARNLCDRAQQAEDRVLSMLQLFGDPSTNPQGPPPPRV